eukprot:jgi/Astpho2/7418/Aster-02002
MASEDGAAQMLPEHKVQVKLAAGKFDEVAPMLDELELQSPDPGVLDQQWPMALHMLGHIFNDHLCDARFLWKRSGDPAKQDPEAVAAFLLLQCMWNQDFQGTSPLMHTLACHACTRLAWASPCKLLSRSDSRWLQGTWAALASHAWSPPAQLLVKAIAGQLQQHNLKLVSHAYANIGPNKLAAILGMTPDAAVQVLGGFRAAIVGVLEDEIMQDNLINGTCIASVLPDEAAK